MRNTISYLPKFVLALGISLFMLDFFSIPAGACQFPEPFPPPYAAMTSWEAGHSVHVYIDALYSEVDRDQIWEGVRKWNTWDLLDCSFINFVGGESRQFSPEEMNVGNVPDYTVYWGKSDFDSPFAGGTLMRIGGNGRGIAALIRLKTTEVPFIVMQLLEGESLRTRLRRVTHLPHKEVISMMLPIAEAIETVHENGMCHRDLKPENIFLAKMSYASEVPMLLDFGIVKRLDRKDDALFEEEIIMPDTVADPFISTVDMKPFSLENQTTLPLLTTPEQLINESLTRTGAVLGTPLYMSPEQLKGQAVDHRTDIYSFCAVMYEMLSGFPPFQATTAANFMNNLLHQSPEPFSSELGIPVVLMRTVSRGLAKNKLERQQSMREVIKACSHKRIMHRLLTGF